jgi:TolB-like protein
MAPSTDGSSMTPSVVEVRRQLDRMLQSQVFASRPRSAEILKYVVEQSIRNGFTPISQQQIATHGLGFDEAFSPGRSAEVRVKVARLREAIARYYRTAGRNDPLVFAVSQGPYRLVTTSNGVAHAKPAENDARHARRARPTLLVVEPEVSGKAGHDGLGSGVSLRIVSLLVEDSLVTVSGPLRHDRIAANGAESAATLADQLGFDYVVETQIRTEGSPWRIRLAIIDTRSSDLAVDARHAFDPRGHAAPADGIAAWICHRIGVTFATPR